MRGAKILCSILPETLPRFALSLCIRHGRSAASAACENAAKEAGFTRLEMGATLSGVEFYKAKGYAELENQFVPLGNGESLAIVKMAKQIT
jgi:hypothetical protein